IAPSALSRMRLARHEQHAESLAQALDREHGAVIHGGELARCGLRLDLDDVWPGMLDIDRYLDLLTDPHASRGRRLTLMGDGQLDALCARAGGVDDLDLDVLRAADDSETRRAQDLKPAIEF